MPSAASAAVAAAICGSVAPVGQTRSLTQLGITEINLTANTVNIELPDGSVITGQTTFTRANGTVGTVAMVRVRVGEELLLARVTRRSVGALDLAPGKPVLKAVSVAQENVGRG